MKSKTALVLKHLIVVTFSFFVPLLPSLLANIHFGTYQNIAQAVLTLIGAIYVTVTHKAAPALTINGLPVNISTVQ